MQPTRPLFTGRWRPRAEATKHDAEWYNEDENFRKAVSEALGLKRTVMTDGIKLAHVNDDGEWETGKLYKIQAKHIPRPRAAWSRRAC